MGRSRVNRYGRKPTRGVRPWLLLPKVVCVSLSVGGLAAAVVVIVASGLASMEAGDPRRVWGIEVVGRLFRWLFIPALLGALGFGAALLLQHPRSFLRMRWVLAKLAWLGILIPAAHVWSRSRLMLLREGAGVEEARQLLVGLAVALAGFVVVVVLGRLKPRLGQNWARSFAALGSTGQKKD